MSQISQKLNSLFAFFSIGTMAEGFANLPIPINITLSD
jgi:putative effector of murein hydrolase LrgA (UPF0299 family)